MDFLSFIAVSVLVYYIVSFLSLWVFESDFSVVWCEHFGISLSTLKGKVVWITGASSGIGEGLAYQVAKHGGLLVISARRVENLEKVKVRCLELNPSLAEDSILVMPLDVTDYGQHRQCFSKILSKFGRLDILVNNAGRSQRAQWEEIDIEVDREMFELNVFSGLALTRLVVKHFNERGTGQIVVMSSLAGVFAPSLSASYNGAKHALHGYYNTLRVEKPHINVSILCPGPTFSEFLQESFTNEVGVKYGIAQKSTDHRMTAERCAQLCLVAVVNKLDEAWISVLPFLPIVSLNRFYPNLSRFVSSYMLQIFQKRRDN